MLKHPKAFKIKYVSFEISTFLCTYAVKLICKTVEQD